MTNKGISSVEASEGEKTIREHVRALILENALDKKLIHDDSRLIEDLGYNSLAGVELIFALEDDFDLPPIDEEAARKFRTAKAVEDYIVAQLRNGLKEMASDSP